MKRIRLSPGHPSVDYTIPGLAVHRGVGTRAVAGPSNQSNAGPSSSASNATLNATSMPSSSGTMYMDHPIPLAEPAAGAEDGTALEEASSASDASSVVSGVFTPTESLPPNEAMPLEYWRDEWWPRQDGASYPIIECDRCEDLYKGRLHEFYRNADDHSHYWLVKKPPDSTYREHTPLLIDGHRPVLHHNVHNLRRSALLGCKSCRYIVMSMRLDTRTLLDNFRDAGPALVYFCSYEEDDEPRPNGFTVRNGSAVQLRVFYGINRRGHFQEENKERMTVSVPFHGPCLGIDEPLYFGMMCGTIHAIQDWVRDCEDTHPECMNRKATLTRRYSRGPRRLLQLRWVFNPMSVGNPARVSRPEHNGVGQFRVVDTAAEFPDGVLPPYAVLSHILTYLGHRLIAPEFYLTEQTEDSLRRWFVWQSLPGTLRDTCRAAWALGMQHVWIDTLCIRTDSAEEVLSYTQGDELAQVSAHATMSLVGELPSPEAGLLEKPAEDNERFLQVNWPNSYYRGDIFALGPWSRLHWVSPWRPSPLAAVTALWNRQGDTPSPPMVDLESLRAVDFSDFEMRWCCLQKGESDLYRLNYPLFDVTEDEPQNDVLAHDVLAKVEDDYYGYSAFVDPTSEE